MLVADAVCTRPLTVAVTATIRSVNALQCVHLYALFSVRSYVSTQHPASSALLVLFYFIVTWPGFSS